MVLAVDALQIAVGKKDITHAVRPAQNRLLTGMQGNGGNVLLMITAAIAMFALQTVYAAVSRTKPASLHFFNKFLCVAIHGQHSVP